MKKDSLKFFEKLCNASGPAGFEREPTLIAKEYVEKYADEISSDKLGSLIFAKHPTKGSKKNVPVILLPGHVDEIGFMVAGIHESGFLTFHPLGGWPDHVLLAQRVIVQAKSGPVPGMIAAKPIHLMTIEERGKLVKKDKMYIDIGCSNADEARAMGVRVGDGIVPDSKFSLIEKTCYKDGKKAGKATLAMGKALDNRFGVFVACEVMRRLKQEKIPHANTVVGAATTQEEVGLRGAMTTGYKVNPDVCLTLDVTIAGDVPGIENNLSLASLGDGVGVCALDASMIPNQSLKELVLETAEAESIPYKITTLTQGGTDAGAVHKSREGCPSIVLGAATRHIHSHVGIIDLADIDHCVDLVIALIKRLDAKTVASLTAL